MTLIGISALSGVASETADPMDHSGHLGEKIHESRVQGYHLTYHLLALPGRSEKHLMTYIRKPNGQPVADAKVGYLVIGPAGDRQKVMAMAMQDAFGGDVNLTVKGTYTIRSKAVFGNEKLMDSFEFEVE